MLPNRISHALDLVGPSEYFESGCASFPLALHRAVGAIRNGECEQAIVAAAHLMLSADSHLGIDSIGILSSDGRSRSFQADAAGYVRSEGAGAIVIKPLARAVADGDRIYARIAGTGVGHGGRGMSLTTPASVGIRHAIAQAFRNAGFEPASVAYVEAHGTASTMSDAIEANAISAAYGALSDDDCAVTPCAVSCLKPCIGHGEVVSGLSALIKVIMAINDRTLPGIPRFGALNEEIEQEGSRLVFSSQNRAWEPQRSNGGVQPLRAALNSYGYTGLNAHILIEEHLPAVPPRRATRVEPQLIVLSARSDEHLIERARRLADFLASPPAVAVGQISLENVAWTLQRGRAAFDQRLAFVADSVGEIERKLMAFVGDASASATQHVLRGDASEGRFDATSCDLPRLIAARDLQRIGRAWVDGAVVDWAALHATSAPQRIALPTYPFARATGAAARSAITANQIESRHQSQPTQEPAIARREPAATNGAAMHVQSTPATAQVTETDAAVRATVVDIVARQLGIAAKYLKPTVGLHEYGADSHTFTALQQGIEARYDIKLTIRTLMEYRTVDALVRLVAGAIGTHGNGGANGAETIERPAGAVPVAAPAPDAAAGPDQTVIKALEMLEAGQLRADDVRRIVDLLASK